MAVAEQSRHTSHPTDSEQRSLSAEIRAAEKACGITTDYDRLREASLFIDRKFMTYALITGATANPERIFGDNAWADYLDGRAFAKAYGKEELTIPFIYQLHRKLTQRSNPEVAGKVRDLPARGGAYDSTDKPATYTHDQIDAIEQNPQLTFERVPKEDETSKTGYINYQYITKRGSVLQEKIARSLLELCRWFNESKRQKDHDPFVVAAQLKRQLVSLHPMLDANGTLSTVLMNWSLENDGQAPSMLADPGDDILTDEATWINEVVEGSKYYAATKKRQTLLEKAGIESPSALVNLGQEKSFYEYIFKHIRQAPPLPTNGSKHNHQLYETFLTDFMGEMNRFQDHMSATSRLFRYQDLSIDQGGLISPESSAFVAAQGVEVIPPEVRELFFTKTEAYRGGIVTGVVDDAKICQMFQEMVGVGTGYRSLQQSNLPPTSSKQVSSDVIQESIDYYNKLLASTYFIQKHPDRVNPYATIQPSKDVNEIIYDHTRAQELIFQSPFVSTSAIYEESKHWATAFNEPYAANAQHGVLLTTLLPREGKVMLFGERVKGITVDRFPGEYEVLVSGGIQPASLIGIEVYDRSNPFSPSVSAKRVDRDGEISVVIKDRRSSQYLQRTYKYNPQSRRFQFAHAEAI